MSNTGNIYHTWSSLLREAGVGTSHGFKPSCNHHVSNGYTNFYVTYLFGLDLPSPMTHFRQEMNSLLRHDTFHLLVDDEPIKSLFLPYQLLSIRRTALHAHISSVGAVIS